MAIDIITNIDTETAMTPCSIFSRYIFLKEEIRSMQFYDSIWFEKKIVRKETRIIFFASSSVYDEWRQAL